MTFKIRTILIAINFLIVLPALANSSTAKHYSTLAQIELFDEMISKFEKDTGRYPTTEEGLDVLLNKPPGIALWKGPYINHPIVPLDYWGNKYIYFYPPKYGHNSYDLYSCGKNGLDEHGEGDDISNWQRLNKIYYFPFKSFFIQACCFVIAIILIVIILKIRRKNQTETGALVAPAKSCRDTKNKRD